MPKNRKNTGLYLSDQWCKLVGDVNQLMTAVSKIEKYLGLKLAYKDLTPHRCKYGIMSPTGVELGELQISWSDERQEWSIGGMGWTCKWQELSDQVFGEQTE